MTISTPKPLAHMSRNELIEEINLLGPWVHGAFDLGNGLIVEDRDKLHKKRIEKCRDYFVEIIADFYGTTSLHGKSISDVGCNAGYFLYELQKKFSFRHALGLEPRESNLAKARFIADFFGLAQAGYELRKFDILGHDMPLPKSDIVIMPGVLHHLSDHLQALRNLFAMTGELCIVETCVLPDEANSENIAAGMFLGESLYRGGRNRDLFGIVGFKLETDRLDGATYQSGIVGVTTAKVLAMMMEHVGFVDVEIFRDDTQLRKEVFNEKTYRQYNSAIVVGSKTRRGKDRQRQLLEQADEGVDLEKFETVIPLEIIGPLYEVLENPMLLEKCSTIVRVAYESMMFAEEPKGIEARSQLWQLIGNQAYCAIMGTFKHAPHDKVTFEFAKTKYQLGDLEEAERVLLGLTHVMNLDWRTVFMTYFLLAKIRFDQGDRSGARKFNAQSLRAYPGFSLAVNLGSEINA